MVTDDLVALLVDLNEMEKKVFQKPQLCLVCLTILTYALQLIQHHNTGLYSPLKLKIKHTLGLEPLQRFLESLVAYPSTLQEQLAAFLFSKERTCYEV